MKIINKFIEKQKNPISAPPVTIAFLGDSVTQGCFELYKTGPKSFETEFRVDEGYHTKLRHLFEICYPSVPVNMIHAGISGDDVVTAYGRVDRDVISYHPDLTIVSFGLNDCCNGLEKLSDYEENLEALLKKLLDCGTEVIFMTPNLMAHEVSPEVTDDHLRGMFEWMVPHSEILLVYLESARRICAKLNVPVCDCSRKWEKLKENGVDIIRLLSNRINHPTEEMHMMFAVSLFELIQGM